VTGTVPTRSVLFAPANHAGRIARLLSSDADVAVLDLEDAVALNEKENARAAAVEAIGSQKHPRLMVRINGMASSHCHSDLLAVVRPGLAGVLVPKVESPRDVAIVDWVLSQLEAQRSACRTIEIIPLIENAAGVLAAAEIARASQRVRRLAFGVVDYVHDLRLEPPDGNSAIDFARNQLVHASRAAAIDRPIDGVVTQVRDADRFKHEALRARRSGFGGKLCIHPDQVGLANECFQPSESEIRRAQEVVEAFGKAEARGEAAITLDGEFIDYPVAERARRIIAEAQSIAAATRAK